MLEGKKKKIGVLLSYVDMGMNMVIQLVYTPVMIRLLGQSEYGLYTLAGSVVSYLSLFSLGFTGAYVRFYSQSRYSGKEEETARLNGMFLTVFSLMSLAALFSGFCLSQFPEQVFGGQLSAGELKRSQILMRILTVNLAMSFPASLFTSIVSAHEQFFYQRVLSLAGILANPFLALPLLLAGRGSVAVVCVTTLITFMKFMVNVWFCLKKLKTRFLFNRFRLSVLREISVFSFFLFLNMLIDQLNWNIDKLILSHAGGTRDVAVYGVGAQINSLYLNFSTAISSVFAPKVNRLVAQEEEGLLGHLTELFIKVGRVQFAVLALIASGFLFFGKYFIVDIYVGKEYEEAYWVALLLIVPVTVPLIQNLGLEIQRAMNKHQFRSVLYTLMACVNVACSIPLAYCFGPSGAAAGTAAGLVLANGLLMNWYYAKGIGINIRAFWKQIRSLAKGLIAPALLGIWLYPRLASMNIWMYLFCILIYTVLYGISFWLLGLNRDEKALILGPLSRLRRALGGKSVF